MKPLSLIGYASGIAANDLGCADGPLQLQRGILAHYPWAALLQANPAITDKLANVSSLCQQLASEVKALTLQGKFVTTLGGDHSCAIGTWSGIHAAIEQQPMGLIWIDAHLDSHTFETSHTGNIHGMPLACLLGYGDKGLTHILSAAPKILPQHLCIIGTRSYEAEEYALLKGLNVSIFSMADIKQQGLQQVLAQATKIATTGTVGFGMSIDLDSIDPQDAPGVGCPEPEGIQGRALCAALQQVPTQALLGLEIVEFNPHHDHNGKTDQMISNLLRAILKSSTRSLRA